LAVLGGALYLGTNMAKLPPSALAQLRFGWLAAGTALIMLAVWLGTVVWWLTLRSTGQRVSWLDSAQGHLISNLAKYVPGYAWQVMGKALLTRQMGVPAEAIAVAMLVEMVQTVAAGGTLVLGLLPAGSAGASLGIAHLGDYARFGSLLILAGCIAMPWVVAALLRSGHRDSMAAAIRPEMMWATTACMLASWLVFGAGYWCLGAALAPLSLAELPLLSFVLVASVLGGLVVIFVPGGIGVRESIMVLLLGASLPAGAPAVLAILCRLVVALGEIAAALTVGIAARKKAILPFSGWLRAVKERQAH
jgi:uncharacterized membrane protein YbhN (UPF0104 family)